MALKPGTLLEVDQTLMQVVKSALDKWGIDPQDINHKKRRTCLDGRGGGGSSAYNGYFTIKVSYSQNGNPDKIIVCDGATYSSAEKTSATSLAYVNGVMYPVEYWEGKIDKDEFYILLEFTPPAYDSDGNITNADDVGVKVVLEEDAVKASNEIVTVGGFTTYRCLYVLGSFLRVGKNGKPVLQQRHGTAPAQYTSNGIAYIDYYVRCEADDNKTSSL